MVYPFLGTIRLEPLAPGTASLPRRPSSGSANYTASSMTAEFWSALRNNVLIWAVDRHARPDRDRLPARDPAVERRPRADRRSGRSTSCPVILPIVVIGLVWGWIYDPLFGVLNTAPRGGRAGRPGPGLARAIRTRRWSPCSSRPIWATFGFVVVMFLAGLQGIDMELVDAAQGRRRERRPAGAARPAAGDRAGLHVRADHHARRRVLGLRHRLRDDARAGRERRPRRWPRPTPTRWPSGRNYVGYGADDLDGHRDHLARCWPCSAAARTANAGRYEREARDLDARMGVAPLRVPRLLGGAVHPADDPGDLDGVQGSR